MKKRKGEEKSFVEKMLLMQRAGMAKPRTIRIVGEDMGVELESIEDRIEKILGIVKKNTKADHMIFFVMYDIEDNKVRTEVSKYLEKKGLVRVQKSIFMGNTERAKFAEIKSDLSYINSLYENSDSIMLVPISSDELRAMTLIGTNIDYSFIMKDKNTLFF